MRTMSNPSSQSPAQPVKISLSPEHQKRLGSSIYRRKVKRMVQFLTLGEPMGRRERANEAHYWLDSAVIEDRRQRSPSERLVDQAKDNAQPKTSVAY